MRCALSSCTNPAAWELGFTNIRTHYFYCSYHALRYGKEPRWKPARITYMERIA